MRCLECGSEMKSSIETHKYIKGVATLKGVEVRRCPQCGEEEVVIPNIEAVHARIAEMVAHERKRLSPAQIRFLRTYLGYSSVDFAKLMGVDSSTVSRWESLDAPQRMSVPAEKLIRLMVLVGDRVQSYSLNDMATLEATDESGVLLVNQSGEWKSLCA